MHTHIFYIRNVKFGLFIGKAHTQLRRLRNESSILKDAVITAIPAHYSKVLFTCTRMTSPLKCIDYYLHYPTDEKEKLNVCIDFLNITSITIHTINTHFRNRLDHRKLLKNLRWDVEKID